MPSVTDVMMKGVKPLSDAKGKLVGQVLVPPQVMTEYHPSPRAFQGIIPHIDAVEDINKMDIITEEIDDTTTEQGEMIKEP